MNFLFNFFFIISFLTVCKVCTMVKNIFPFKEYDCKMRFGSTRFKSLSTVFLKKSSVKWRMFWCPKYPPKCGALQVCGASPMKVANIWHVWFFSRKITNICKAYWLNRCIYIYIKAFLQSCYILCGLQATNTLVRHIGKVWSIETNLSY